MNFSEYLLTVCLYYLSIMRLSPCLSASFLIYRFRRCVFLQKWKRCIMNEDADNLQCGHSTLCKPEMFLTYPFETAHTHTHVI